MSGIIKALPTDVINQIAAGEIIQEPSSVLKELLENSIDANSKNIEIYIQNGGKNLIQVIDDGQGMIREDAINCCQKHATSKLSNFCDLETLQSMGFRGEALASIAAICDLEIKTATENNNTGTKILIKSGNRVSVEDYICSKGSCFTVKNLFYTLPARRAFLRSDAIEYGRLIKEFYKIAIANYKINFSLYNNEKLIFKLNGDNCKSRIIALFGDKFKQKLLSVDEKLQNFHISGFIENPEGVKKYKSQQYIFVNNRFIYNNELKKSILDAFDGVIANNYQPSYFIFIDIPASEIDVNIHPQKTEIKFMDMPTIASLLTAAVKRQLGIHYKAPLLDFSIDTAVMDFVPIKNATIPDLVENKNYNPFHSNANTIENINSNVIESFVTDNSLSDSQNILTKLDPLYDENNVNLFDGVQDNNINQIKSFRSNIIKHIFHIKDNYVLAIASQGLYIINSKRAIKRILYERYFKNIVSNKQASQTLLYEYNYSLPTYYYDILFKNNEIIKELGFIFDYNQNNKIIVKGLPGFLKDLTSEIDIIIDSIIETLSKSEKISKRLILNLMAKILVKKIYNVKYKNLPNAELIFLLEEIFEYENSNRSICEKKNYMYININNIINDLNN